MRMVNCDSGREATFRVTATALNGTAVKAHVQLQHDTNTTVRTKERFSMRALLNPLRSGM